MDDYIEDRIDTYRVGLFQDLFIFWGQLKLRLKEKGPYRPFHHLKICFRRSVYMSFKTRNWRALKNYFNGFLAEHEYGDSSAGHGWTRNRALNDLIRIRMKAGLEI